MRSVGNSMDGASEVSRLQAENDRLIALLESHGIDWHASQPATLEVREPEPSRLSTAEKVSLFRRLFRGRTDVNPMPNRVESTRCKPYGLARTPAETREFPLQGADIQAVLLPDWPPISADQLCRRYGQFESHFRNRTRVRTGSDAAKRPPYHRTLCGE